MQQGSQKRKSHGGGESGFPGVPLIRCYHTVSERNYTGWNAVSSVDFCYYLWGFGLLVLQENTLIIISNG